MSDWFVSSAAYAAIPQWAATTAYTVGQFVRALATPAQPYQYWVFRCTTAGTSAAAEPTWTLSNNNNATRADGTVTWTNVTGQAAYGWSGCAGTLLTLTSTNASGRTVVGDRVFVSSDSVDTFATSDRYASNNGGAAYGLVQHISVNRAGSVPPVEADILPGATLNNTAGNLLLDGYTEMFWHGFIFRMSSSTAAHILMNNNGTKRQSFKKCAFQITGTNAASRISVNNPCQLFWDDCTVQFAAAGQAIGTQTNYPFDLTWINTAAAIAGATIPTTLFAIGVANGFVITCRGVDLIAVTGTLVAPPGTTGFARLLLDSCRIAPAVTRIGLGAINTTWDEVELVNCYDGTNAVNERTNMAGTVITDRSTVLSGGAQDDIGPFSLKLVSSVRSDFATLPLDCFWLDVENTLTGSAKTATVEIISSASLNNNDIRLLLQYMGAAGSPLASFGDSLTTVLTPTAALPSSSVTWNAPPATPQKQKLQVTFTPQRAGRLRALLRLGKPSTTVWINPQIVVT